VVTTSARRNVVIHLQAAFKMSERVEIELWRVDYNTVRPHSALDNRTPEEFVRDLDSGCRVQNKVTIEIKKSDCLAECVDQ
jgi:hypothetical protein